ncbi:MAG: hypothetical protein ACK4ND_02400 [Cytophagaceae bacterium]
MYFHLLLTHSWTRWLIIISAGMVLFFAIRGMTRKTQFGKYDNISGALLIGCLHLQLLLGLILYIFYSPFTHRALQNMGAAMKEQSLRYWGVEHIFGMMVAIILAQIGRTKTKKTANDRKKHKTAFWYTLISILIILGTVYFAHRPWFRFT